MDDNSKLDFLRAVAAAGDKANMWAVGEALGLERIPTENLSVALMEMGYLEMASLSGAVRLTPKGGEELAGAEGAEKAPDLEQLMERIAGAELELGPAANADLKVDLATLRAALVRSRPLNPVLKSCLAAIDGALEKAGPPAAKLRAQLAALKPA